MLCLECRSRDTKYVLQSVRRTIEVGARRVKREA
jgi:hypothetical protein